MSRFALLIAPLLAAPAFCAEPESDEKALTYDEDVLPIFRANCATCHNADRQEGGLNLVQFPALMQGGGSGEVLDPGDGEYSYLYMLAAHESEPVMPPGGQKLAAADLETLKDWIDAGARENAGSRAAFKPKADLSLSAAPTGQPDGPPPMPADPYAPDDAGESGDDAADEPAPLSVEPVPVPGDRADAVVALAASPWAPLAAVGGEGQVVLFNSDTLEPWGVLPFPEGRAYDLRFSTTGRLLVAGGGRGAYRGLAVVWDVTTGERVAEVGDEPDAVLAADISPDQSMVAIGTVAKRAKVFSTATGELLYSVDAPTDWATAVAFSPDGVLLAVGDRAGNLGLWEAVGGLPYADLKGHKDAVTALSWRADSNLLASSGLDGTVHLWKPEDGSVAKTWNAKAGGLEAVAFAADGRLVTAGRSGEAALWDVAGKQLRAFPKRPDLALSVAPVPHGESDWRVLAGDWTGAVAVWDAADGAEVGTLSPRLAPLADRLAAAEAAGDEAAADRLRAAAAVSGQPESEEAPAPEAGTTPQEIPKG